jgi:hypothetical protein
MTDPRLAVAFDGLDAEYATFAIDNSTITYSAGVAGGSSQVGMAVGLSAADTVALVAEFGAVIGKLIKVDADNYATVQVHGGMTLPAGTGATLTLGAAIVGDLVTAARGYIQAVDTAQAAQLGKCRGYIIDAATTTAVEVYLD